MNGGQHVKENVQKVFFLIKQKIFAWITKVKHKGWKCQTDKTTIAPQTTQSNSGAGIQMYGTCGGEGYSGPTQCAPG